MKRPGGFTLIELITVIMVTGILSAAIVPLSIQGFRAYEAARTASATLDKLSFASERLAAEIRDMKVINAVPDIQSMSESQLSFTRTDYMVTPETSRIVTISQGNERVYLKYNTPSMGNFTPTLTNQLSSLVFSYFDSDSSKAYTAADVRYIEFELTLTDGVRSYSKKTRVELRNA